MGVRLVGSCILALAVACAGAPAAAVQPVNHLTVKNCVNVKTGKARIVTVSKCRAGEKLVQLQIPAVGNTIISGEGPPASNVGVAGDYYFDVDAKKFYGPKTGRSAWGVGFSLIGPTGPAGPTGPIGSSGSAGASGAPGAPGAPGSAGADGHDGGFGAHGSFHDEGTVELVANTATPIPVRVTNISRGVSVAGDSKITVSTAGVYNISFSTQLTKDDSGTDVVSIWLCRGAGSGPCTNVPWTNTDLYLAGNGAKHVAAWNFFMSAVADDYFQLMISSTGTTLKTKIISVPATTAPDRPALPGTILTVNQVG